MKKIQSNDINVALNAIISSSCAGKFGIAEIAAIMGCKATKELTTRIEQHISGDGRFFYNEDLSIFAAKRAFFEGKYFVITPNELEIEGKILFPGHRFAPFCAENIFPSEVQLINAKNAQKIDIKEYYDDLTKVFPSYFLLGAEQLSDFFIAEHPQNRSLNEMNRHNQKLIVNVFDMADIYDSCDFTTGDALLCRVVDYELGLFDFEYLSGEKRRNRDCDDWKKLMTESLIRVFERFEDYLDIPEQLNWAFFISDHDLLVKKSASIDELLFNSSDIEIKLESGHSFLSRRVAPEEAEWNGELPDGLSISKGEISQVGELIKQSGSFLSPEELDAYILDSCYNRELEYNDFFVQTFEQDKLEFVDEAQEVTFNNYIEERFETLSETYNRVDDEPKAEIRSQILELISARRSFLSYLKDMEAELDKLPEAPMADIAEAAKYFNDLLRLLNNPNHTVADDERDAISDALDKMEAIQEKAISLVNETMRL